MAAFSLIDLIVALGIAVTLSAMAMPSLVSSRDEAQALGAARYVSTRLQHTRMQAIAGNTAAAMRVTSGAGAYSVAVYIDGNRNGVLTRDIQAGVDRSVGRPERLVDQFPGVDFGTVPALPAVDSSSAPPGTDPVRLGSSDLATFTPIGTATSGSLYIRGRHDIQYVVRIFGDTGKTRILRFNSRSRQWMPLTGT